MSTPCSMANSCKNSPILQPHAPLVKCALCRLSPDNEDRNMIDYWRPLNKRDKHPELERRKQLVKALAHMYDLREKYNVDKNKRKVSRLAKQAEKKTEASIIKATKNSGRTNKDGDHVAFEDITLDTKLQTTKTNPTIKLEELEKVRKDAARAGSIVGGLVIRNKNNVGCVVLAEADFALLMKRNNG